MEHENYTSGGTLTIHPPDTFRSVLKTICGHLRVAVVVIIFLHILSVPFWLKGYWAPRSTVMRLLYQCLGSREEEQARWSPDIVVVSACEKPILTAISPAQTRIGVWARSQHEDWIVDVEIGKVLVTVPHSGWGFTDFVSEDLVVRRWYKVDPPPVTNSIFDVRTGEVFEATQIVWENPDLDDLRKLYRESNGNAVQFIGSHFSGIVFYTDNGLQVRDFVSSAPKAVQELIDGWGIPKLRSPFFRAADRRTTAGDDTCLIGIEPDNGTSPITYFPSICFASVAEPILLQP